MKNIGLSARGREILSVLRVGQPAEALERLGIGAEALAALRAAGFLQEQGDTLPPTDYHDVYAGWRSQKGMLIDDIRTNGFEAAIAAAVRPGDIAVDVGTGSGILAMFAARAGAGRVDALEITAMADWAERLAATNGLAAMRVIRGDAAEFDAGGPVDVVMGEFAGMWLIDEWRHYAAFAQVRDRWLKPEGRVVPRAAGLYLSAVDSRKLHLERGWGFFDAPVYGFDLSEVLRSGAYRPARYILSAEWKSLVATREIARFDFRHGQARDFFFATEARFPYPVAGMFHGFIGHFDLDMGEGLPVMSTSCGARETHWHQSYFPIPQIAVPAGGAVMARLRSFLDADNQLKFAMTCWLEGTDPGQAQDHVFDLE